MDGPVARRTPLPPNFRAQYFLPRVCAGAPFHRPERVGSGLTAQQVGAKGTRFVDADLSENDEDDDDEDDEEEEQA